MSDAAGFWERMERPAPAAIELGGVELRRGSRVRLSPRPRGDVWDGVLAGRIAVVDSLEIDAEGNVHVAVTVEDDPGRDLGQDRKPGHRFFYGLDEIEPLDERPRRRILVAGIGNVFLGDDAFGVEVVRALAGHALPPGVDVVDFGIRGMDLAYALADYDVAVLVDAAPLGERPGTLAVIEPELDEAEVAVETHGLDPVAVLRLAARLGELPGRILVVACEPEVIVRGEHDEDLVGGLGDAVAAAVPQAVELVTSLVEELAAGSEAPIDGKAVTG